MLIVWAISHAVSSEIKVIKIYFNAVFLRFDLKLPLWNKLVKCNVKIKVYKNKVNLIWLIILLIQRTLVIKKRILHKEVRVMVCLQEEGHLCKHYVKDILEGKNVRNYWTWISGTPTIPCIHIRYFCTIAIFTFSVNLVTRIVNIECKKKKLKFCR